jgi:hypothetical protein
MTLHGDKIVANVASFIKSGILSEEKNNLY